MSIQPVINISKLISEYASADKSDKEDIRAKKVYLLLATFFAKMTSGIDIDDRRYIMDPDLQITGTSKKGSRNVDVLTYSDGSEWVILINAQKMRFCGFLYLQNALKQEAADTVVAAPNKMAFYGNKKQIIYLSQYCGETRAQIWEHINEYTTLSKVGFTDMMQVGGNLRKKEDKVYVFDTEKASFSPEVHNEIDAFAPLHDDIRSVLEEC